MANRDYVWVFCGARCSFPSAVFIDIEKAELWIKENKLMGTLTQYPLNEDVYSWALRKDFFQPKKEHEFSPEFIQKFSSASQEHFHYEDGLKE